MKAFRDDIQRSNNDITKTSKSKQPDGEQVTPPDKPQRPEEKSKIAPSPTARNPKLPPTLNSHNVDKPREEYMTP